MIPLASRLPDRYAVFLVSVAALFLELLLIRWVGAEIRLFAYLQNSILIVCFLGLGMGCFASKQPTRLWAAPIGVLLLVALLTVPPFRQWMTSITELMSMAGSLVVWDEAVAKSRAHAVAGVAFALPLVALVMVLLWECFVPLGQILARTMNRDERPLLAYSWNVAGSLVGVWLFVGLSALALPPWVWFLVAAALLLPFTLPSRSGVVALLLAPLLVVLAPKERDSSTAVWTPYQKIGLSPPLPGASPREKYSLTVNNTGYQGMLDLRDVTPNGSLVSQYDLPLLLHPSPKKVLIVGAGSGNDAAGALRNGAEEVVGVEIDPVIIRLGEQYHPEAPYQSPRVKIVNDDARAYFERSDERFDVVIFGLLDSHTTSGATNVRLDHYVYTKESIERAKSLLAPGGVMALSFEARRPYITDRIARTLKEAFSQAPVVFRIPGSDLGWGGVMFLAGDLAMVRERIEQDPRISRLIAESKAEAPEKLTYSTEPATDDWPYLYLEERSIPAPYWVMAALAFLLVAYGKWRLGGSLGRFLPRAPDRVFFFLGAAFLLLETQSISRAAVALGSSWQVNAVIITAVLLMVLAANFLVAHFPSLSASAVYPLLSALCVALYFVDLSVFAGLPYAARAVAVGAVTTLPLLLSGIAFARAFATAREKDHALGANLLGSLVGGLLQSLSFIVGTSALLLVVGGIYGLAWASARSAER